MGDARNGKTLACPVPNCKGHVSVQERWECQRADAAKQHAKLGLDKPRPVESPGA